MYKFLGNLSLSKTLHYTVLLNKLDYHILRLIDSIWNHKIKENYLWGHNISGTLILEIFLTELGMEQGSTQSHEDNWAVTWFKEVVDLINKLDIK